MDSRRSARFEESEVLADEALALEELDALSLMALELEPLEREALELEQLPFDASSLDERLAQLQHLGPPAALDQLVLRRCTSELQARRARIASDAEAPLGASVSVPLAERCVYAAGLALYGREAFSVLARAVWRVFSG